MVDLQFIEIRDILGVIRAEVAYGIEPASILIYGNDFRSAYEVYVNDAKCPEFLIDSNKKILAQLPESQAGQPLRTVAVISSKLTRTDRSKIVFRIGDNPCTVTGIERLIQTFLKLVLQGPDIFMPNIGGRLLASVGKQLSSVNGASLVTDFQLAVNRARTQLLALQARDSGLNYEERLLFARVIEAKFVPSELALLGKLHIGNQAGSSSVVGLGL